MSKHNRHDSQRGQQHNPTPVKQEAKTPEKEVRGICYWREREGWMMAEVTLPESVAREHATRVYEPDILGMVVARATDRIERAAQ